MQKTKPFQGAAMMTVTTTIYDKSTVETYFGYDVVEFFKRELFGTLQVSLLYRPLSLRTDEEIKVIFESLSVILCKNAGTYEQQEHLVALLDKFKAIDSKFENSPEIRSEDELIPLMEKYNMDYFEYDAEQIPLNVPINFHSALYSTRYFLPENTITSNISVINTANAPF